MPQTFRITSGLESLVGKPLLREALDAPPRQHSAPATSKQPPSAPAVSGKGLPTLPAQIVAAIAAPATHNSTPEKGIFQLTAINSPATPGVQAALSNGGRATAPTHGTEDSAETPRTAAAERVLTEALAEAQHAVALVNGVHTTDHSTPARTSTSTSTRLSSNSSAATAGTSAARRGRAHGSVDSSRPPAPAVQVEPRPASAPPPTHHARTHTASPVLATPAAEFAGLERAMGSQHCMLSYNWSHQGKVLETRGRLVRLGFNCWLDVDHMKQGQWCGI